MTKKEKKQIEKLSVNEGYLIDRYITSVDGNPPIWTKEHIRELFKDFYLIPKNDTDSKIKPFFNVGDWIVNNEDKSIGQINHILYCKEDANLYGYNHTNGYFANDFEKDYHLWTIEDAKPGDVLMCESGWTCIFKDSDLFNEMFSSYCFMTACLDFVPYSSECHTLDSRINGKLTPATEQQRNLFFKKMKKAGYQWDADKKELHRIIEPQFKVGDSIVNDYCSGKVIEITNDAYLLDTGQGIPLSCEHNVHLWTIQDAKDGDVLACYSEVKGKPIEQVGIFKQYVGRHGGCSNAFLTHTGIDWDGNIIINGYMGSTNILPATKEQRDQFFKKMKEAGYQWDADKKELHKIQPHYDIKNFKPFDKVLIRVGNNSKWTCDFFSYYHNGCFHCVGTDDWSQCIPFEGNETLLGTTDMCNERFINW